MSRILQVAILIGLITGCAEEHSSLRSNAQSQSSDLALGESYDGSFVLVKANQMFEVYDGPSTESVSLKLKNTMSSGGKILIKGIVDGELVGLGTLPPNAEITLEGHYDSVRVFSTSPNVSGNCKAIIDGGDWGFCSIRAIK